MPCVFSLVLWTIQFIYMGYDFYRKSKGASFIALFSSFYLFIKNTPLSKLCLPTHLINKFFEEMFWRFWDWVCICDWWALPWTALFWLKHRMYLHLIINYIGGYHVYV